MSGVRIVYADYVFQGSYNLHRLTDHRRNKIFAILKITFSFLFSEISFKYENITREIFDIDDSVGGH